MAKGSVATQNQIPSNSTSRRVFLYVFTYFGVLYVVSVDLRFSMHLFRSKHKVRKLLFRFFIVGQPIILSANKYCYSEGLRSNKAFIHVDSAHSCTNSTDLSDPSRDQANLASLL